MPIFNAGSEVYLIALSVIIFIAAGAASFTNYSKPLWTYIDIAYYPLGAVGLILLFFQQGAERRIIELQDIKSKNQQMLSSIEAEKPRIESFPDITNIIVSHGDLLKVMSSLGRACRDSHSVEHKCMVAIKTISAIDRSSGYFPNAGENADIFSICSASERFFNELKSESAISPVISDLLLEHYKKGLSKGLNWMDSKGLKEFIDDFDRKARERVDAVSSLIVDSSDTRTFFIDMSSEEIQFAKNSLTAFSACLWAPPALRSGEYSYWKEKYISAESSVKATMEEIASLEKQRQIPKPPDPFKNIYWPYILIFALSLKFGKGVAAVQLNIKNFRKIKF